MTEQKKPAYPYVKDSLATSFDCLSCVMVIGSVGTVLGLGNMVKALRLKAQGGSMGRVALFGVTGLSCFVLTGLVVKAKYIPPDQQRKPIKLN